MQNRISNIADNCEGLEGEQEKDGNLIGGQSNGQSLDTDRLCCRCPIFCPDLSTMLYVPTNMTWIEIDGCICPQADAICVRPEDYTKPVECLNKAHLNAFAQHLVAKPCDNTTALVEKLSSSLAAGYPAVTILLVFVLIIQVAIFWLIFMKMRVRQGTPTAPRPRSGTPPARRSRPRPPVRIGEEEVGRPLAVFSVENMRWSHDTESPMRVRGGRSVRFSPQGKASDDSVRQ
ncbi:hypothetical protein niasHS_016257 [Heterodera schachtii]|uniref:Uncharacterized protein n=1 Tax=Heterodera schachtii TaxID=97005 RepID=A0ABD2HNS0_HETSC